MLDIPAKFRCLIEAGNAAERAIIPSSPILLPNKYKLNNYSINFHFYIRNKPRCWRELGNAVESAMAPISPILLSMVNM